MSQSNEGLRYSAAWRRGHIALTLLVAVAMFAWAVQTGVLGSESRRERSRGAESLAPTIRVSEIENSKFGIDLGSFRNRVSPLDLETGQKYTGDRQITAVADVVEPTEAEVAALSDIPIPSEMLQNLESASTWDRFIVAGREDNVRSAMALDLLTYANPDRGMGLMTSVHDGQIVYQALVVRSSADVRIFEFEVAGAPPTSEASYGAARAPSDCVQGTAPAASCSSVTFTASYLATLACVGVGIAAGSIPIVGQILVGVTCANIVFAGIELYKVYCEANGVVCQYAVGIKVTLNRCNVGRECNIDIRAAKTGVSSASHQWYIVWERADGRSLALRGGSGPVPGGNAPAFVVDHTTTGAYPAECAAQVDGWSTVSFPDGTYLYGSDLTGHAPEVALSDCDEYL